MKKRRLPTLTRDTGLFLAGLALTINEAVLREGERPYLLMLFAGMMGLPVFLRSDESKTDPAPSLPTPPSVPATPEVPKPPQVITQDGTPFS